AKLGSFWSYTFTRLSYTPLNDDELKRVQSSSNSSTIRSIFYRAKNDNRDNHFDIIRTWNDKIASLGTDYTGIKEAKLKSAERAAKSFISSVYRVYGANPLSVSEVIQKVSSDLYKFENMTIHEYASSKLIDSFIKNEHTINKIGIKAPDFHEYDFFKAQRAYFEMLNSISDEHKSVLKSKDKYQIFNKVA
ncbi:MAG: hypothetical protein RL154_1168, partial [Pseudomonadota bacterium]